MAITIYRIIGRKPDPGYPPGVFIFKVILDNESIKKVSHRGGLPDNDAAVRAAILADGEKLFSQGDLWDDSPSDVESPQKDFNDKVPLKANINAANSVPELRAQVAALLDAVKALQEIVLNS